MAEGLASWLEFERQCRREMLFSERYLTLPIAQILAAHYGGAVEAEHSHPVLSRLGRRGRPPQLDFAVRRDDRIELVVESKWIASRRVPVEEVIWDCVRLELAAHHYKCDALFILAGENGKVDDVLLSDAFNPSTTKGKPSRVLGVNGFGRHSLNIHRSKSEFAPALHELMKQYSGVKYPQSFICGSGVRFPKSATDSRFTATVWLIRPEQPKKRGLFTP